MLATKYFANLFWKPNSYLELVKLVKKEKRRLPLCLFFLSLNGDVLGRDLVPFLLLQHSKRVNDILCNAAKNSAHFNVLFAVANHFTRKASLQF